MNNAAVDMATNFLLIDAPLWETKAKPGVNDHHQRWWLLKRKSKSFRA
jgi:hypothetical protein